MDFFTRKLEPDVETLRQKKSVITCDHVLQKTATANSLRMDAIIHHVTTIPVIKNLLCVSQHDYLPNVFEAVQVETDVYFQLTELKHKDGQLETIKFELFSYDHEVQFLQGFVDRCNIDFARKMANKLGTNLYYFDMITQNKSKKTMQNALPNTHLLYTKHQFHTTRSFDNVFFEQRDKVRNHVKFFLTRKDWYEQKGIPYTLGFMFHGDPGCGKTSTIKAIANTAHRHILNIHLSEIKSKSQLRHLFFNDEIHVYNGTVTERFIIPVHERLYVIEDIDAMGDAVLKREWKKPTVSEKPKEKTGDPWLDNKEHDDEIKDPIDLSFLLNLLDGTLEASGRILAISSNFPERIDRALIRPGRIDMIVHFKKCNRQILREMVTSFYDKKQNDWTTEDLDYKWSPAEVNQILFRNFGDADEAIKELKTLKSEDLYGFTSE
jgi:DNA polymerase III delta prime subunit